MTDQELTAALNLIATKHTQKNQNLRQTIADAFALGVKYEKEKIIKALENHE